MKNNIELDKNYIMRIIFGLLGLAIVGLVTLTFFTVKDIFNISNEIQSARTELEKKYIAGQSLKDNTKKLEDILPRLKSLDLSFVNQKNTLDFVSDLEQEAERLNLEQTINLTEISVADSITPGAVQLTLMGSPENLLLYLNVLDKKSYYLNISKLKIVNNNRAGTASATTNLATLNIEGTIYWR